MINKSVIFFLKIITNLFFLQDNKHKFRNELIMS